MTIAAIFALRVFGFMAILPVLSLHAHIYTGASAKTIGLAIGVYGLFQALLQIPMGRCSDRYGRKPVVMLGLLLLALGSLVAANATSMTGLILGRALQGAGAIGSTLNAWCADVTDAEMRTRAMAVIGMTIGATFMLAMVLGPWIVDIWSLSGLFWVTFFLAIVAMLVVSVRLPGQHTPTHATLVPERMVRVLAQPQLQRLNFGIMALHATYTATFIVLPKALQHVVHMPLWKLYLPMLVVAALVSVPSMILAETKGRMRRIFLSSIVVLMMATSCWGLGGQGLSMLASLQCFFMAFTVLEALLPSLTSKYAPVSGRGTAMGVYACAQYLGIFIGGTVGGMVHHYGGSPYVFLSCVGLLLMWFCCAWPMSMPGRVTEKVYALTMHDGLNVTELVAALQQLLGVQAVAWAAEEAKMYLKVDKSLFKEEACLALINPKKPDVA